MGIAQQFIPTGWLNEGCTGHVLAFEWFPSQLQYAFNVLFRVIVCISGPVITAAYRAPLKHLVNLAILQAILCDSKLTTRVEYPTAVKQEPKTLSIWRQCLTFEKPCRNLPAKRLPCLIDLKFLIRFSNRLLSLQLILQNELQKELCHHVFSLHGNDVLFLIPN